MALSLIISLRIIPQLSVSLPPTKQLIEPSTSLKETEIFPICDQRSKKQGLICSLSKFYGYFKQHYLSMVLTLNGGLEHMYLLFHLLPHFFRCPIQNLLDWLSSFTSCQVGR